MTQTDINDYLEREFAFSGKHVAALIEPKIDIDDDFFICDGLDLRPILSQIISSNLDADRLTISFETPILQEFGMEKLMGLAW